MNQQPVFILSGEQGAGKTTRLREVVTLLEEEKIYTFGFYALGYWKNQIRSRFNLVDIRTGTSYRLCERADTQQQNKSFVFYPETIRKGEALLLSERGKPNTLAVIDEIGHFELNGKIWAPVFSKLVTQRQPVFITVRKKFLENVMTYFHLTPAGIYRVNQPADHIARDILQKLHSVIA